MGRTVRLETGKVNSLERLLRNGEANQFLDAFQHPAFVGITK
jgi:hypothetical protein